MYSFISESVKFLCEKYGKDISNVNILLPTKRAQSFFNAELARYFENTAIWQPKYFSVDVLCESVTGKTVGDKIKLLIELYRIYQKYHPKEQFDDFYNWGEMLLSDFDAIDNYLLDARSIFCNINDLYEIDTLYDDVAQEQRDIINNFWSVFKTSRKSDEKNSFISVWNTLYNIYQDYNDRLNDIGITYKGMLYRQTAEILKSSDINPFSEGKYAIIGFNALSNAEKVIFDKIKDGKDADFLWDYDDYYIKNKYHEAGTFIRTNMERYGNSNGYNNNNFASPKSVNIVDAPTDALQCKYVFDFLEQCSQQGKIKLGRETAIVLTDEKLLMPVLYSIPQMIKTFNVTAGYPMGQTPVYILFEYLVRLFLNIKDRKHYKELFQNIIKHHIVDSVLEDTEKQKINSYLIGLDSSKTSFINIDDIIEIKTISKIFDFSPDTYIGDYLLDVFSSLAKRYYETEHEKINLEFMTKIIDELTQINNLFAQSDFVPSTKVYVQSIRKHIQSISIPFDGEPLLGVQIMGILETRNLDFENVLILSMNDENYPSSSVRRSFIPHVLREGYSLPTHRYQEAMYTYYFYRLMQRSTRIDIAYCSSTEGLKNGEVSRYVSQLKFEKIHPLNNINLSLKVNSYDKLGSCLKDEKFRSYAQDLGSGKIAISPSAIDMWMTCQMKFYFYRILKIKSEQEVEEGISAMDFGNSVHKVLDVLYEQIVSRSNADAIEILNKILKSNEIKVKVQEWIEESFPDIVNSGSTNSIRTFIESYIETVIKYDISRTDNFVVKLLEEKINTTINLPTGHKMRLAGFVDRIDSSNLVDMIIDYKTGSPATKKETIESLFDSEVERVNKPYIQSLIYCYMYKKQTGRNVVPALFYPKVMKKPDFNPRLLINGNHIDNYDIVAEEFESQLIGTLCEIVDNSESLHRTSVVERCEYCDYKKICLR